VSATATAYVWKYSPYRHGALNVHAALADTANDLNDNQIWFGVTKLAAKARVGRSTVMNTLAQMIADGFLEVVAEQRGPADPKVHRLLFPDDVPVVYEDGTSPRSGLVQKSDQSDKTPRLVQKPKSSPITNPKEPKASLQPKKTRVDQQFTVSDDLRAWCIRKNIRSDPDAQTERFIDHYVSNGATRVDWKAAWRNWMRNADSFNSARAVDGVSKSTQARRRVIDQARQNTRKELAS
jgi:hypothetical protein